VIKDRSKTQPPSRGPSGKKKPQESRKD